MKSNTQRPLGDIVADGLWNGAVATVATTAAVTACGMSENQRVAAPINAISHILWGDRAARQSRPSAKYTVPGVILNAAAVTSWAILQELMFDRRQVRKPLARAMAEGAAISGLAYVTDYYLVPSRFTPGFEKRLTNKSLAGIYSALAVSLGIASWFRSGTRR
jgi:hypothetical protein